MLLKKTPVLVVTADFDSQRLEMQLYPQESVGEAAAQ